MGNWVRKNRKLVFEGHRVKVYEDELIRPDGETVYYDLVVNRNGAACLPVDHDGNLILVSQYRNILDAESLEIPAGSLEPGETDAASCALREVEEETGYIPQTLYYVNRMVASSGLFQEMTSIYIGMDLKEGNINRDPDEFMSIKRISPEKAHEMIYTGEISDAKTIIAIQAYFDLAAKKIEFPFRKI